MFFTNTNHFLTEVEPSYLKEDPLYLTEEKKNGLKALVITNMCIDLFHVFIFQSSRHFLNSVVRINMHILTKKAGPTETVIFNAVSS